MSKELSFMPQAWDDYLYWQVQDKKTLKRINQLLQDILRNGFEGIGNPEPLKGDYAGYWSRRIDEANRIVYKVAEGKIIIVSYAVTTAINNQLLRRVFCFRSHASLKPVAPRRAREGHVPHHPAEHKFG